MSVSADGTNTATVDGQKLSSPRGTKTCKLQAYEQEVDCIAAPRAASCAASCSAR